MNKYFCLPCRWACTLTPSTWAKSCWSTQKGWKCGLWSIWWLHMILSLNWRLNSLNKRPKLAFEYWKYKVINLVIQDFRISPGIGHIPRVRDCHSFAFSPFFTPSPSPVPLIWAPVHFPLFTFSSHSPHFPPPHLFSSGSLPCQQQRSNGFLRLSVTHCLAGWLFTPWKVCLKKGECPENGRGGDQLLFHWA